MIVPERTWYAPGQQVRVTIDDAAVRSIRLHRLHEAVAEVGVEGGVADLGAPAGLGGYGVTGHDGSGACVARTAFDVLDDAFDRPRYGFVTTMDASAPVDAMLQLYRRLHLSLAQFYDWAYRHSTLLPPADDYLDPLGQPRSLSVVDGIAERFSQIGTVPLGYSAVYAIGADEVGAWNPQVLRRADGEPYRLGEDFLVLVDPGDERWLAHYTGQLRDTVARTRLQGFHLDQYGWPKFAENATGRIDVGESFVRMLHAVRDAVPDARIVFNNVNDFPTWRTATAPQDGTYIEVWPPHETLQDLADLVARTRGLRPEHPPIMSAYLSCLADDEAGGLEAAKYAMAAIFSSGGTHLLLGEDSNALVDPYYPRNARLEAESVDVLVPWYDFLVRYGDLLLEPTLQEVTEFYAGGINEDVVIADVSRPVSTKADAGSVWLRVFRLADGSHVVHVVNLSALDESHWDRSKPPVRTIGGALLKIANGIAPAGAWCASPEHPDMRRLDGREGGATTQSDALSAGQEHVAFELPALGVWTMVWLPAE